MYPGGLTTGRRMLKFYPEAAIGGLHIIPYVET